jgi:hypothetical protein
MRNIDASTITQAARQARERLHQGRLRRPFAFFLDRRP